MNNSFRLSLKLNRIKKKIVIERSRSKKEEFSTKMVTKKLYIPPCICLFFGLDMLRAAGIYNPFFSMIFTLLPMFCVYLIRILENYWEESLIAKKAIADMDNDNNVLNLQRFQFLCDHIKTYLIPGDSYEANGFTYKTGNIYFDRKIDFILYRLSDRVLRVTGLVVITALASFGVSFIVELQPTVVIIVSFFVIIMMIYIF